MNRELTILLQAMRSAGAAIESIRRRNMRVTAKANQSPLTEADLAANDILKTHLLGHFPHDGWLSEESVDDISRLDCERVWIVDPIDGTKEFIKNIPEYAISAALVVEHKPILAAVYNPATEELFYASKNQGAWLNQERITCDKSASEPLTILASRTEVSEGRWEPIKKNHHIKETGSIAYKLGLVAAGRAQATFSLTPKSEWDIAAGVLLVTEAGGIASDLAGQAFLFNQKNALVNGIVAAGSLIHSTVLRMAMVK